MEPHKERHTRGQNVNTDDLVLTETWADMLVGVPGAPATTRPLPGSVSVQEEHTHTHTHRFHDSWRRSVLIPGSTAEASGRGDHSLGPGRVPTCPQHGRGPARQRVRPAFTFSEIR